MNRRQLKKKYTLQLKEAEKLEAYYKEEWEPWPSGEMNESQVPIDMCRQEVNLLEEFLEDINKLKD